MYSVDLVIRMVPCHYLHKVSISKYIKIPKISFITFGIFCQVNNLTLPLKHFWTQFSKEKKLNSKRKGISIQAEKSQASWLLREKNTFTVFLGVEWKMKMLSFLEEWDVMCDDPVEEKDVGEIPNFLTCILANFCCHFICQRQSTVCRLSFAFTMEMVYMVQLCSVLRTVWSG